MKNNNDTRTVLSRGPIPADVTDISTWSAEQIRLAGAWSKHEVDSWYDPLTAAYDWVPDWIGHLDALEVNQLVRSYYTRGC
jgi:hypothetical protein